MSGAGSDEWRDAPAGIALAAEIVFQALAVGGLREHAGERVFSDAARAGEEKRAGDAVAGEHAAQGADNALVAEEVVKGHRGG